MLSIMTAIDLRGRRLLIAGAVPAGLLLIYFVAVSSAEPVSTARLVSPEQRSTTTTAPPPPPMPAPAPAPSVEGLRLFGLLGRGAIIGLPDGAQRLVMVGRDVLPGLRVARLEQHHVILAWASGELQLGFEGPARSEVVPSVAAAAPRATPEAGWREETLRYRVGLEPQRSNGRVTGFAIRPGAEMPALQRAGLGPGDLILRVNGSTFDEERMQELAWQMDNSDRVEFEIERSGRRITIAADTGN